MPPTPKLPFDDQLKIYAEVKDTPAVLQAMIIDGTLDLFQLRAYETVTAFKTSDPDTVTMLKHASILAKRTEPVLITGESGTGKELVARILHGSRRGEFVAVNTTAVTDTLFESELFGHIRGSFTGANHNRNGLIKQTETENGVEVGTLFLDEIGDMPLHLQSKLLRVIQNKVYRCVGDNRDLDVKCRIIAATHQDLKAMIKKGTFRLDLYERLNVFQLNIKPLRERLDDLPLYSGIELLNRLLELLLKTENKQPLSGNIRQMQSLQLRAEVFGVNTINEKDIL